MLVMSRFGKIASAHNLLLQRDCCFFYRFSDFRLDPSSS